MLPALQTLVNNSNNIYGHTLDRRRRAYAYLLARDAGLSLGAVAIKATVSDVPGFNDENYLNGKIYQMCANLGLTTDFRALESTVINPVWSIDAGVVDAGEVLNIIKYARLNKLGAI